MTFVPLSQWLKRKPAGPKPKTPLKRSVRVKKVSAKRRRANSEYSVRRKAFLLAHTHCQAWERIVLWAASNWKTDKTAMETWYSCDPSYAPLATEIHHMRKPKCKYLNDESTWLAVSRWSHEFIERNKSIARRLGLLHL